jgi:perosamine synthetase
MILHNKPTFGIEEEQAVQRVLRSGWVAQGEEVEAFENEFCKFISLSEGHAVAVSSGTASLFLALWAIKAQDKKVAFPVYACSSLRHAVAMSGAEELLVDVAHKSPNIDIDMLCQSKADITIVPHMFGLPLDISRLKDIDIIEDCAQALGASVNNIPVGLQDRIGVFSFYATKLMTSGGQGGMLVSKDKTLVDAVKDYREFDQRRDNRKRFNFQMTDIQAAVGRIQLKKLHSFLKRRSEIFESYREAGLPLLDVSKNNLSPVRYRAVLLTERPKEIIQSLINEGIKAINPIEDWELLGRKELFPNAFNMTQKTVSLPLYPLLTDCDIKKIINIVKDNL